VRKEWRLEITAPCTAVSSEKKHSHCKLKAEVARTCIGKFSLLPSDDICGRNFFSFVVSLFHKCLSFVRAFPWSAQNCLCKLRCWIVIAKNSALLLLSFDISENPKFKLRCRVVSLHVTFENVNFIKSVEVLTKSFCRRVFGAFQHQSTFNLFSPQISVHCFV